jgi:hypothetical protein
MTIVHTNYRTPRARKRKHPVEIPRVIVSAQPPKPKRAQPAIASRIVSAPRKTWTRFGPVQEMDAEEHQRRGDAAVELFREIAQRARGDAGS